MDGCIMPAGLRVAGTASAVLLAALLARDGRADEGATAAAAVVPPPPSDQPFLEYGIALTAEVVASPGPACSSSSPLCVLGSGGGIVVRAGWRPSERLYLGLAYEVSKQDPHELYRIALLQQGRIELRRYVPTGRVTSPFFLAGIGFTGYGGALWPLDTWGPNATLGGGIELQLGRGVLEVTLAYRPTYLRSWQDSSALVHDGGVAHFVVFEMAVEQLEAL